MAGGGVPWRSSAQGTEVVLVHRPKYDDWSFPKGKAEPGEPLEMAALREVREETGLAVVLGPELGSSAYTDGRGRPKVVRYWAMTPTDASQELRPEAADEVDRAVWTGFEAAAELLTFPAERVLLGRLRSLLEARPAS